MVCEKADALRFSAVISLNGGNMANALPTFRLDRNRSAFCRLDGEAANRSSLFLANCDTAEHKRDFRSRSFEGCCRGRWGTLTALPEDRAPPMNDLTLFA
jgi:hypothetical protein